eukprot:1566673-Rhodomonas_salina.1
MSETPSYLKQSFAHICTAGILVACSLSSHVSALTEPERSSFTAGVMSIFRKASASLDPFLEVSAP